MLEQRSKVAAAAYHMENQNVLVCNAIDDDVLPGNKTPDLRAQIFVAAASHLGKAGQQSKPVGDGINHAVGNLDAAALLGHVIPDVVKLGFRFWCETARQDRKSTRLNSSHADIYTLSLHDALPIWNQSRGRQSRCCRSPWPCNTRCRQARLPLLVRNGAPSVSRRVLCCQTCASAFLHFVGELAHGLLRNVAAFTTS